MFDCWRSPINGQSRARGKIGFCGRNNIANPPCHFVAHNEQTSIPPFIAPTLGRARI